MLQIGFDSRLKLTGTAVGATADLLVGEFHKPALHQVQPGTTGRREVKTVAWVTEQPAVNHRSLVGSVVVQDQVHVQRRRHLRIDAIQELAELDRAMPPAATSSAANSEVVPWRA